jgi:tetratricopeptide (TPR) repeat protein
LLANPGVQPGNKSPLYFSLGKIYDECGQYDEAFECYREANLIFNSMVSYNADAVTEMTGRIMKVFNNDFLAEPFPFKSDSRSPLFIVGMPRSGTTLAASILSNHPRIATAGELETINDFTLHLPEMVEDEIPYPEAAKHLTPGIATRFMDDYHKRLRRDAGADAWFVIDKYPFNFRHLGLIAMLFPESRIIHCTRHPLDIGLSNYFQQFSLHFAYSFDLENIGHFYGEYARLMEHWRKVLPMRIIDISYEEMVMDTEKVAREALELLGLDWDERCLAPHTNPCAIETASQWQVRQPIYSQSVGRWRYYDKYLASLKERLNFIPAGDGAAMDGSMNLS